MFRFSALSRPRLGILFVMLGTLTISACGSDMRTMNNSHMQKLAYFFAEHEPGEPLPRGWRRLDGREINYRFANETYAIYSIDEDEQLLVMHLYDNGEGRLEADDDRERCAWNTMMDQLTIECDDTDMEWHVYTNGPDLIALDLDEEEYAILRKRPGR
ncbi:MULTISPECIES: hypothetical protein [Thalassospira]|uniref:hypothetical protein n=1 Tax=Thalassospira TaxID=168934 RepID=UPI000E05AD51|nr:MULTISPECIES: hypothetical protein [Thalassospira]MCC4239720.1 hypothetical protein [Thalassospira povalilytica]MEE3047476.1 hypothetical protein [Pseudomonadota bacterium]RCK27904.1 hypothetical protein TH8_00475 [Thalassospira profundimaris]